LAGGFANKVSLEEQGQGQEQSQESRSGIKVKVRLCKLGRSLKNKDGLILAAF
jgi:hypothetical protein